MRYSNNEIKIIRFLLQLTSLSRDTAPEVKNTFKRLAIDPDILYNFARSAGTPTEAKIRGFLEFASAPPAGNARDLMAQGLKGPEIGQALAAAEADAYAALVNEVRKYVRGLLNEKSK